MYLSIQKSLLCSALAAMGLFTACNKSDDNNNTDDGLASHFFISAEGTEKQFILKTAQVDQGTILLTDNIMEMETPMSRWTIRDGIAFGVNYSGGNTLGLAYRDDNNNKLKEVAQSKIPSGQNSLGIVGNRAIVLMGQREVAGEAKSTWGFIINSLAMDGSNSPIVSKLIDTRKKIKGVDAKRNEQATFVSALDMGNGDFLSSMIISQPRTGNGNWSTGIVNSPDSIWVARFDKDLNIKKIYRSNKLSYSAARTRAWYYNQLGNADNGDVYVFSGAHEDSMANEKNMTQANLTTKPAGALLIKKDAEDFDSTYFFDISAISEGYKFHEVFSAGGTKFLIEFYNKKSPLTFDEKRDFNGYNRLAIVDAASKIITWVTGLPTLENISSHGVPTLDNGKLYIPIMEKGQDPAIYVIDPATAKATKGLIVKGATSVNAVGRITKK